VPDFSEVFVEAGELYQFANGAALRNAGFLEIFIELVFNDVICHRRKFVARIDEQFISERCRHPERSLSTPPFGIFHPVSEVVAAAGYQFLF